MEVNDDNSSNNKVESFYKLWERIKDTQLPSIEPIPELDGDKIIFDEKEGDYYMKIVLACDGAVGKTTLRRRFMGEGFKVNYQATIGADFAIHEEKIGSYHVKFVIWDLAGQLHFHQVRKLFYKAAHGALIVFDITNPSSFDNIKHWINELWLHNEPVPFVIVGNKRGEGVKDAFKMLAIQVIAHQRFKAKYKLEY
ncbi:MAG: Rab family GTPase [Candidatus Hodarchaeales archaeon]